TSSAIVPLASSCRTQSAAKDFEIDPIWNRVSGLIGRPDATSAKPRTTAPSVSFPSVTASARPGACVSGRSSSAARPIRSNASSSPLNGSAAEEELQLPCRGLRRVGPVHDVLADQGGVVPADRARRSVHGIGRAHQRAPAGDRRFARELPDHHRPPDDEVDELAEERLVAMLAIMLFGGRPLDHAELEGFDREALRLGPSQDLADQTAPNAVGFHDQQGRFNRDGRVSLTTAHRAASARLASATVNRDPVTSTTSRGAAAARAAANASATDPNRPAGRPSEAAT